MNSAIIRMILATIMIICVTAATIALGDLRIMWFMLMLILLW